MVRKKHDAVMLKRGTTVFLVLCSGDYDSAVIIEGEQLRQRIDKMTIDH